MSNKKGANMTSQGKKKEEVLTSMTHYVTEDGDKKEITIVLSKTGGDSPSFIVVSQGDGADYRFQSSRESEAYDKYFTETLLVTLKLARFGPDVKSLLTKIGLIQGKNSGNTVPMSHQGVGD